MTIEIPKSVARDIKLLTLAEMESETEQAARQLAHATLLAEDALAAVQAMGVRVEAFSKFPLSKRRWIITMNAFRLWRQAWRDQK